MTADAVPARVVTADSCERRTHETAPVVFDRRMLHLRLAAPRTLG
jgi:hypothetical protein